MAFKEMKFPSSEHHFCYGLSSLTTNPFVPSSNISSVLEASGNYGTFSVYVTCTFLIFGGRLESVARLFRIILDATSPYFAVEDRLWQSSVCEVFKYFLVALWGDEQVGIPLKSDRVYKRRDRKKFA